MIVDLYDFDKTVYPKDSTSDFWLFCLKKKPGLIKYLPVQLLGAAKFFAKKTTLTQFKEKFFCFLPAIDAEALAREYWQKNGGKIYDWFRPAENDAVTVVCSASPEFEIRPILEKLGVKFIIATQVDTKTGRFEGENCKGEEKVRRIKAELGECEFRNAYTDNPESDAPMLSLAKNRYMIKNGEIAEIS